MVIRHFLLLIAFSFFSNIAFANVSATVDRMVIEEGETFVLTVRSDSASPDLDVLEQFFNVLGTSRSSKVSIVNGSMTSVKEWIVTLSPKKTGITVIPGITVGNEKTAPIKVQVVKAKSINAAQGADIFLEVSLNTNMAYVQSEVIYIARLYRAVEIREGSLTEPEINSAVVERMGEDVTFQTTRNQRLYQVTERRFALFPQKSGSLAIPPTVFDGQVLAARPSSRNANDPFDRFFQSQQRMRRVQIKSDALALDVQPQPASFTGENWLPSKRLLLSESWSIEPPQFKVGEPITRTLRIEATGQTGAQLPVFKEYPTNGIKQYADQPKVETGLKDGSLHGIREEKFAIIPTTSGKLVLPEVRVYWWDTVLDKEQVVKIPPRVIDVAPAAATAQKQDQTAQVIQEKSQPQNDGSTQSDNQAADREVIKVVEDSGYWSLVAFALGLGWLLTALAWVYQLKKTRVGQEGIDIVSSSADLSLKEAKKQLKVACDQNDPNLAKQALLAWGNAAWPENKTRSLLSVGEYLQDSIIIQSVIDLDEVLYSHVDLAWNGEKFWNDVGERLKKPRYNKKSNLKSLPGLYPQ